MNYLNNFGERIMRIRKLKGFSFFLMSIGLFVFLSLNPLSALADTIIDNGDPDTSFTGDWRVSGGSNPYGDDSLWSRGGSTYTWTFTPSESGVYQVSMWWTQYDSRSSNIPVTIEHSGGTATEYINQQENGGQWNILGTYSFEAGLSYSVTITSQPSPASTCADAVRFIMNDPPEANNDEFNVYQNSSGNSLNVLANDTDPDPGDTITITAVGTPNQGGTVTINGTADALIYTPASGFTGTETFTYTIEDTFSASDQATVTVTVQGSDDAIIIDNGDPETSFTGDWRVSGGANPYGADSLWSRGGSIYRWTFIPPESGYYEVSMWWTQYDSRSSNIPVTIEHSDGTASKNINQQQNGGQWNILDTYSFEQGMSYDVTITSQPNPTSTCADAVRFIKADTPVNSPPEANDDPFDVLENSSSNELDVLANDSDPDPGDSLTITAVGTPNQGGTVTINATSDALIYSPATGFTGTETFTYTIEDTHSASDQATVTVTVAAPVNNPPEANNDSFSVLQNSSSNELDVLANDTDPNPGDSLTITAVSTPNHGGTVTINAAADALIYTPAAGFIGTETFTYTIEDTLGASDQATVTVTVAAQTNNPPEAVNDSYTVYENSSNNPLNVMVNDSDPDPGDTLTVTAVGTPNHGGTVTINGTADGLIYTPAAGFEGTETFTYTIEDTFGASDQATVTVTVVAEVQDVEQIFVCCVYAHPTTFILSALPSWGAVQEGDTWRYTNTALNKEYVIHVIDDDIEAMKQAFRTENSIITICGHANYGTGPIPATHREKSAGVIYGIRYIDDPRILNISSLFFPVSLRGLIQSQAYPDFQPIFSDGESGIMPFDFDDPRGDPPYNYYITYKLPGDPTHYRVETVRNSALERCWEWGGPAWYSPDGSKPDADNPAHRQYFITLPNLFSTFGNWNRSTSFPLTLGEDCYYAFAGHGSSQAKWTFTTPSSDNYTIFAWWPYSADNTSSARYTINHAGGSTTVTKNQRINSGQWNELGEFYFNEGEYSIVLTDDTSAGIVVADAIGIVREDNPDLDVVQANFYGEPLAGNAPQTVEFENQSTGNIHSILWDFGDGNHDTIHNNPVHTYTNPGTYTVSLTVSGPSGSDMKTKVNYVRVGGTAPYLRADFRLRNPGQQESDVPSEVQFREECAGEVTSYFWEFGDGGTSTEEDPTHTYTTPGLFTVSLTVTDADGNTSTEIKENLIKVNVFFLKIDSVYPEYHFGSRTILFIRELEIPKEEMRFSRLFYESCKTGPYYLDTLGRGNVFYTVASAGGGKYLGYLKGYMDGKSDHELWGEIQDATPNVFDYFDFTQPPPTVTSLSSAITMGRTAEPKQPQVSDTFDPEKEARILELKSLELEEIFQKLKDIDFMIDKNFMHKAIFTALKNRSSDAITYSMDRLKLPRYKIIKGEFVSQDHDFLVAKEILRVFHDEALESLIELYRKSDPVTKSNILAVLAKMTGGNAIRNLLIQALEDKTFCEEEDDEMMEDPLRICDVAYNQLVLRYMMKNVLRTIGPVYKIKVRDYHIDRLKESLPTLPFPGSKISPKTHIKRTHIKK